MEKYFLDQHIKVICVTATPFPDGILAAHQKLQSMVPFDHKRRYFGISFPNQEGTIVYRAAVEESYNGEAEKLGCETFIIKKGEYISIHIPHYTDDISSIDRAFKKLIAHPDIDPQGECIEMYISEDEVRCMVRLGSTLDETQILSELTSSFQELLHLISSLAQEQLNTVPFQGSWTAAQVGEHLLKSYGVIETLNGNTTPTQRRVNENVQEIKDVFLNFNIKMKSPAFTIPSEDLIDKEQLLRGLKEKTNAITHFISTHDLSLTCLDFEFPDLGTLTRWEWIHFINYHTQRHNRQLKNIIQQVTKKELAQ